MKDSTGEFADSLLKLLDNQSLQKNMLNLRMS